MKLIALLVLATACSTMTIQKSCKDLVGCIDLNSKLTGNKYLYNVKVVSESVTSSGNIEWTKDNADPLLGELLTASGYMRLRISGTDTYQILNARDIRYVGNIPQYHAEKNGTDNLPKAVTSDWGELVYKTLNEPSRASDISRNIRPFMSRYGRVIDDRNSNKVIVVDNLTNLHRVLKLMREIDVPLSDKDRAMKIADDKKRPVLNYNPQILPGDLPTAPPQMPKN